MRNICWGKLPCVLGHVEFGHLWRLADRWKCGSGVQKRVCV